MKGNEIREWRARNGYASQKALMDELGIASRTTMSVLENSGDEIPRIDMLALIALERQPVPLTEEEVAAQLAAATGASATPSPDAVKH